MEKKQLVERAKMYVKMLSYGVHPVTGLEIPLDSVLKNEKIRNCFSFIAQTLDEYIELSEKVEKLEREKEEKTIVISQKQRFAITREQCESISLSKRPIPILSFMKNINAVINTEVMEKLTSTRITKWLSNRGLISALKIPTTINKTVYKPSELAEKIGICEEHLVDTDTGEEKIQVKLDESAQLFILENIEDIIKTT